MAAFIVYDTTTGAVRGAYTITHYDATGMESNTPQGCAAMEVDVTDQVFIDQKGWFVKDGTLELVPPPASELLSSAQTLQVAAMDAAYQTQINNGFTSSALGSSHLYPGADADQTNLIAVITASMIPIQPADWTAVFWCAPVAAPTSWNYLPHTAAQIQQVGIDAMTYIMAAKMHRATRIGEIQAATTVDGVLAIAW